MRGAQTSNINILIPCIGSVQAEEVRDGDEQGTGVVIIVDFRLRSTGYLHYRELGLSISDDK